MKRWKNQMATVAVAVRHTAQVVATAATTTITIPNEMMEWPI